MASTNERRRNDFSFRARAVRGCHLRVRAMIWIILAVVGALAILRGLVHAADDGSTFAQVIVSALVFVGIPFGIFALLA